MRPLSLSLVGVLCFAGVVHGQELTVSSPSPVCDTQVQEQYRKLTSEGLVTATAATAWPAQLLTITSQVRMQRTQYDIKKNQAELAEQNVAQLLEQLRLAREQSSALQAEVDKLKGTPPASN